MTKRGKKRDGRGSYAETRESAPPSDALRAVMAASPLAIVTLDLHWDITAWSSAAERIFGWSAAEVLGGTSPLALPGHEEEVRRRRARASAGETIVDEEGLRRRKDGTAVPVRASVGPTRDPHGRRMPGDHRGIF